MEDQQLLSLQPTITIPHEALLEEVADFVVAARKRRIQSLVEWSESSFTIPEGRYRGLRFKYSRQPYAKLLHQEIDAGRWQRFAVTGCVQSGKTLHTIIMPMLWKLFEQKESCVFGVPQMELSSDKWRNELQPSIKANRSFAQYLPKIGKGSRGGITESITLTNGTEIKFMSGRGGDEKRSSYTSRCGFVTEVDKMDVALESSRETDPVSQIENRLVSYGTDYQYFLECTVSLEWGRIWQEYQGGTESRIVCPCPHCHNWVAPERDHFVGFKQASGPREAAKKAHWICPECSHKITDRQRGNMNQKAKLLHRGQTISKSGVIKGKAPDTYTLGFRWNAFHNMFWSSEFLGNKEYMNMQAENDESEKEAVQYRWVTPYIPSGFDKYALDFNMLRRQMDPQRFGKSVCPPGTDLVTIGADAGKRLLHWVAIAWNREECTAQIIDYGRLEVPSDDLGVELGLKIALRELRDDIVAGGFLLAGEKEMLVPWQVWVDAGWQKEQRGERDAIFDFMRETATDPDQFRPVFGLGSKKRQAKYKAPLSTGGKVCYIGDNYHMTNRKSEGLICVHINTDQWKLNVHQRLKTRHNDRQVMELFHSADKNEHVSFAKHLTGEELLEEWNPATGTSFVWKEKSRVVHWLDALVYGTCAGDFCDWKMPDDGEGVPG